VYRFFGLFEKELEIIEEEMSGLILIILDVPEIFFNKT
jgi:hypothetical protein